MLVGLPKGTQQAVARMARQMDFVRHQVPLEVKAQH